MGPTLLVLTPMKNAALHLDRYFSNLESLELEPQFISLGFLVSDSEDGTWEELERRLPALQERYRRVTLRHKDFGFSIPDGLSRWSHAIQSPRRIALAKSRNHLLFAALDDEDWVLWTDVDVVKFPADVVQQMWATGKSIVHPNCVITPGGKSFDGNAWKGAGTINMDAMRGRELVRLDSTGGTMLLVHADVHRDGVIFPAFPYGARSPFARERNEFVGIGGGEYETEGFAHMAKDMGYETWGMPDLEIIHYPA